MLVISADVEVNSYIEGDEDVVLSGDTCDRDVESDGILCDKHLDLSVRAEAAVAARLENAIVLSKGGCQRVNTVGYVQFIIATAGRVNEDHERNPVGV